MNDLDRYHSINAKVHERRMNGDNREEDLLYELATIEVDVYSEAFDKAYSLKHAVLYKELRAKGLSDEDRQDQLDEIKAEAGAYAEEVAGEAVSKALAEAEV